MIQPIVSDAANPKKALVSDSIAFSFTLGVMFGVTEALILQQVHFRSQFSPRPKWRDGHCWMYDTHRAWVVELKIVTESTVARAIKKLVEAGVLVMGRYNPFHRDQTRWYRVDYEVLEQLVTIYSDSFEQEKEPAADAQTVKVVGALGKNDKITFSQNANMLPKTPPQTYAKTSLVQPTAARVSKIRFISVSEREKEKAEKQLREENVSSLPPPLTVPGLSNPTYPVGEEDLSSHVQSVLEFVGISEPPAKRMGKYSASSANAILAQLQNSQGRAKPRPVNTCGSLTALWQSLVPRHHSSVGMMPSLTLKKKGQLSHLATTLKSQSDSVLAHVIENWISYCKFVSAQCGLHKTPDVPAIGFVLLHANEALAFTQSSYPSVHLVAQTAAISGILRGAPPPESPVVALPGQPSFETEIENDVMTLDDVLAWKTKKE